VTTSIRPTPTTPADFPVSFTLPRTQTVTIDLYASLLDNRLPTSITAGDSVRAALTITGTGSQSGTAVTFGPANGQLIVYQSASLSVTKAASSPMATLVTANNNVKTVSYKFEASNDNYDIIKLVFTIVDPSAVSMVNLKDGSTIIQSQPAAPTVTFTGFYPALTITSGAPKILDVELVLGNIGTGAGNTGSNITVALDGVNSMVRASSNGSTGSITGSPASGNAIYAYKAVPTITLEALPSTLLSAGTKTLQKFTISSAGNTTSWKQLMFTITRNVSSGNGATIANCNATDCTGIKLYQGGVEVPGTVTASGNLTAAAGDTITVTFVPTNEEQIEGGASKTYELKALNVGGTLTSGIYISTSITNPSTLYSVPTTYANTAITKKVVAGPGLAYTAVGTVVAANDTRLNPVPSYTSTSVSADNTVVGFTYTAGNIVQSYGIPNSFTMTLAEGTTDDKIGATTFTIAGVPGLTCTPYTGSDYTGAVTANTTSFASIKSIECKGNNMQLRMTGLTISNDTGATGGDGVLTITITKGDYAASTVVGANDSDIGLALTALPAPSFVWSDNSASLHSTTTADWTTDYLVKNLPTDTQSLQGSGS
jgi:hypothetical protein